MVKGYYEVAFLKVKNSQVLAYNVVGTFLKFIGHRGAVSAQIVDEFISIDYNNNTKAIYTMNGQFKRLL